MTIKKRLFVAYGAILLVACFMGGAAIVILSDLDQQAHQIAAVDSSRMFSAGSLITQAAHLTSLERGITLRALGNDPVTAEKYVSQYAETSAKARATIAELRNLGPVAALPAFDAMDAQLTTADGFAQATAQQVHARASQQVYEIYKGEMLPLLQQIEASAVKIRVEAHDSLVLKTQQAQAQASLGRWIMSGLLALCLALSVAVVFIIRSLDAQLRQSAFELTDGSGQLAGTAGQVSTSSQSLAHDTSGQAAMIEETSASAEQINSMAKRNAESARDATIIAGEAVQTTLESSQAVADCVQAMEAIGISSSKIAKTLQVIDKIAFQTNILALNAAVEAARAGEAGMGFAVVAEEVRNLAQRCAEAARETSVLVEESLQNSDSGRTKIASLVQSGVKVNSAFAKMKIIVEEIGNSSQEQGRGIDQIGRSIQKMEEGTQKSAANAEQSAAAAEQLNAQADGLRQTAATLSLMVGGVSSAESSPARIIRRPAASRPRPSQTPLRPHPAAAPRPHVQPASFAPASSKADDFRDF